MIKKIEKVLAKIPFNGELTVISTALLAISKQPEILAVPQLAAPLAVISQWGVIIGLIRKAFKMAVKKA